MSLMSFYVSNTHTRTLLAAHTKNHVNFIDDFVTQRILENIFLIECVE